MSRPVAQRSQAPQVDDLVDDLDAQEAATAVARALRRLGKDVVQRWCRLRIEVHEPLPDGPLLFVANHGFGGIVDLNVYALLSVLDSHRPSRPRVVLTHQMAWTLGIGALIEAADLRPASRENALAAFANGADVVVFPGGDVEAAKSWRDRDKVLLQGRSGFARLALEADVPILPVVTAGAGESLFVLTDGQRWARRLQLPRLLRCRALPVSLSIPWGLNIGLVGLLPYLPLPTRLETALLPAVRPKPGESAAALAERVQDLMQIAMDELTAGRRFLRGRPQA